MTTSNGSLANDIKGIPCGICQIIIVYKHLYAVNQMTVLDLNSSNRLKMCRITVKRSSCYQCTLPRVHMLVVLILKRTGSLKHRHGNRLANIWSTNKQTNKQTDHINQLPQKLLIEQSKEYIPLWYLMKDGTLHIWLTLKNITWEVYNCS